MNSIYIHTKTQKEFDKVLEIFEKKGWVWDSGQKPTLLKTGFNTYGSITIIEYKDRFMFGKKVNEKVISFKKFLYLELMNQFEEKEEAERKGEEKIEPSHSLGWTPKKGEEYYSINGNLINTGNSRKDDNIRFAEGNCFKTEAEAQKVLDKRKALRRIHEYMRENDLFFEEVDWERGGKEVYIIQGWDYWDNIPCKDSYSRINTAQGNLLFQTSEDRRKVLDNCAEDLEIFLKD